MVIKAGFPGGRAAHLRHRINICTSSCSVANGVDSGVVVLAMLVFLLGTPSPQGSPLSHLPPRCCVAQSVLGIVVATAGSPAGPTTLTLFTSLLFVRTMLPQTRFPYSRHRGLQGWSPQLGNDTPVVHHVLICTQDVVQTMFRSWRHRGRPSWFSRRTCSTHAVH